MKFSLEKRIILFINLFILIFSISPSYAYSSVNILGPDVVFARDQIDLSLNNHDGIYEKYNWIMVKPSFEGQSQAYSSTHKMKFSFNKVGEYKVQVQGLKNKKWYTLASKIIVAVPSVTSEVLSLENLKPSVACRLSFGLLNCLEIKRTFNIFNPQGVYSLIIDNDQLKKVSVMVNDQDLTKKLSLNDHNETVIERIHLKEKNTLIIKVGSQNLFDELKHKLDLRIVKDIGNSDLQSGKKLVQISDVGLSKTQTTNKFSDTNNPPAPTAQNIKILQNMQGVTRVFPNDPDSNQYHSFAISSSPTHGTAYVNSQGFLYYLPSNDYSGNDQVTVNVKDSGSPSITTPITVNIEVEQNIAPDPIASDINVIQNSVGETLVNPNDANTVPQSFTYEIYQNAAHGIVTPYGSRFTYKPALNFIGTDSFIIKVSDNGSPSLSALKTISVIVNQNTVPVVIADDQIIFQGQKINFPVTYTDSDPGQSHYFSITGSPVKGTAVINQQGVLYYSGKPGESGQDSVVVSVKDSAGGIGTKTISINIVGNSLPVIGNINDFFIFPGQIVSTTITYTDVDSNQRHTFIVLNQGRHGHVLLKQDGSLTYTPDNGFIGTDNITIAVSDSGIPAGVASKIINITVRPNSAPVVAASDLISVQGAAVSTQVTYTDLDADQGHTFSIQTMPAHGTASLDQNGLFTYTPQTGYRGIDSVVVAVKDDIVPPGVGTKTIHISVVDNTIPVVAGNDLVISQGGSGSTLMSFTDPDANQTHTFQVGVNPAHGTVTLDPNNNATYVHTDKCSLTPDSFSINVSDSAIPPGVGSKTIHVSYTPNIKPTATIADFSIQQNETASKQLVVTDPDANEVLTYSIKTNPLQGSATISSTGVVTYTHIGVVPATTDVFEISIKDKLGDCAGGEVVKAVNVNILPNRAPTLNIADLLVEQDSSVQTIMNANDPDQYQILNYVVSVQPVHGTVTINSFGNLTYTPATGYSGSDQFKITVQDNGQPILSADKIVNITVAPHNFPPNPTAPSLAVLSGLSGTTTISAGDPDVGQIHTYQIISSPVLGTATVNTLGVLTYVANPGATGLEEVQVRVTDNGAFPQSAIAYVSVQVIQNLPPNPVAINDTIVSGMTRQFLIAPNDPNQAQFPQTYTFIIETQPTHGSASVDTSGNLTYIAAVGYAGPVTFDIKVFDGGNPALSGVAHVSLTAVANSAPIVTSENLNVDMNVALTHQIQFSDTNSAYQTFTFSISQQGGHGLAVVDSSGLVTYTPEEDYIGDDSVVVTVTDNGNPALSGSATYSINVQDSNNIPPVFTNISYAFESTTEPAFAKFNLIDLMDPDGEVKETRVDFGDGTPVLVKGKDDLGTNNGKTFLDRFEHYYRQYGTYQLTVKVKDNSNAVTTEIISIVVSANLPPVAKVNYDVLVGPVPLTTNVNGSVSTDSDGTIQRYTFSVIKVDTNQTVYSTAGTGAPIFPYTFTTVGKYKLHVCVIDNKQAINCIDQFAYPGMSRPDYGGRLAYASFTATPRQGNAGYSITLNGSGSIGAQSTSIVSYQWKVSGLVSEQYGKNYSDYSYGVNPTMTLPASGLYFVQLIVTDINGNQASTQNTVIVDGPTTAPELIAVNYGNGTFGYRLETHGRPINSDNIFWDLGNGTFSKGNQAFTTYLVTNTYNVKVQTVDANGVRYDLAKTVNLNDDPSFPHIAITQQPSGIYNPGQSFTIDASTTTDSHGPLTYTWTFGDGIPSISGVGGDYAVVTNTYSTPGVKNWELRVTNSQGYSSLYSSTVTYKNASGGDAVMAGYIYPKNGYAPLTVTAHYNKISGADTILYYIWNFGRYDGDIVISTSGDIQNTYYQPGLFPVSVTAVEASGNKVSLNIDSVGISSYNQKPVVVGKNLTAIKNSQVTAYITYTDPDVNPQTHTYSISQSPLHGTSTITSSGELVYTPTTNYLGSDTLKVRVTDSSSIPAFGEATVNITVVEQGSGGGGSNNPPVAGELFYGFETSSYPRQVFFSLDGLSDSDGFISKVIWDFGDGSTPIVITKEMLEDGAGFDETAHVYNQDGTYPVVVKAYDNKGALLTVNSSVVMAANSLPVPRFTTSVSGTSAPFTITLNATASTDSDGTIEEYCWAVSKDGTGVYDECNDNPIHTVVVNDPGQYDFEFNVTDNAHGTRFSEFSMMIDGTNHNQDVPPSAIINTAQSRLGASPLSMSWISSGSVAQNGKTISKTLWQFSEKKALNYGSAASPTYNYNIPGTDYVRLRVFDSAGKSSTNALPVYVGSAPTLKADFSIKGDGLGFSFDSSWSNGHIAEFYLWDFGDGTHGFGENVFHQYAVEGEYKVELTIMDLAGNIASKNDVLVVGYGVRPADDSIGFPSGRRVLHVNESSSFAIVGSGTGNFNTKINFGDGTISDGSFTDYAYASPGIYGVKILTTDNDTGRSKEYYIFVTVLASGQSDPFFGISGVPSSPQTVPYTLHLTAMYNTGEFQPTVFRWGINDDQGLIDVIQTTVPTLNYTVYENKHYGIEVYGTDTAGRIDLAGYSFSNSTNLKLKKPIAKKSHPLSYINKKKMKFIKVLKNK